MIGELYTARDNREFRIIPKYDVETSKSSNNEIVLWVFFFSFFEQININHWFECDKQTKKKKEKKKKKVLFEKHMFCFD